MRGSWLTGGEGKWPSVPEIHIDIETLWTQPPLGKRCFCVLEEQAPGPSLLLPQLEEPLTEPRAGLAK